MKLMYGKRWGKFEYITKFAKLNENLSYISVNTEIEFEIHTSSYERVTALNVL